MDIDDHGDTLAAQVALLMEEELDSSAAAAIS